MEYGVDGQSYCSSCIFYGLNKQCWKCRMYLPMSELQQYKGQWICPNCLMDAKDADNYRMRRYTYNERCARCGREIDRLYTWNGRRLCITCLNDEQSKWGMVGGGPMGGGSRIMSPIKEDGSEGLLSRIISSILIRLGLKKRKEPEIIALEREHTPFEKAKTMNESTMKEKEEAFSKDDGQIEGILKKSKTKEKDVNKIKKKPRKKRKKE